MNFYEAFEHCKNGVATEEEKQYVKQQLEKANEFLNSESVREDSPVKEADVEEVKKAKKKFKWQYVVIPVCSLIGVLMAIAAILGGVFGSAASYAKKSVAFSKVECAELAKDKAYEFVTDRSLPSILGVTSKDDFVVDDMDREFNYSGSDIKNSYYSWIVELEAYDFEIKIEVDTRNGNCKVIKVK